MPANTYGRQVVLPLTNKSGGSVAAGDVVIVDTTNNDAFTTTTSGGFTGGIGIAQETIANNATGRVLLEGYAALVNVNASVTRGNFGKTHTVAKQATDAGASRTVGTFCQFLTGGTTPDARVYPPDLNASSGSVATDAIWDAAGDLAVGTGADTAHRLAAGTAGTVLVSGGAADPVWRAPQISVVNRTNIGSNITTSSTTFVDMDSTNLTTTLTVLAVRYRLTIVGMHSNDTSGAVTSFNFSVGGTTVTGGTSDRGLAGVRAGAAGASGMIMATWLTNVLTPGSTVFRPQWKVSSGTATGLQTASTDYIRFTVEETFYTT